MVPILLSPRQYHAVIFDLDGVITETAAVHAAAWSELFNAFLGADQPPFTEADYLQYVDGKLRYEGVHSFLESRGIELPWGDATDGPELATVCGLGNRKNGFFLQRLRRHGAEVYPSTVALVYQLREVGIRIGVVTASKNCDEVLAASGLSELFEAQVDGVEATRLHLRGKPEPDTFLEAAQRLQVTAEQAVVVEDAVAGVAAGRSGGFGLVIGVDRIGQAEALRQAGADVVVGDLSEVVVAKPNALDVVAQLRGKQLACFFDYDGTLTPIVARPEMAQLTTGMRHALELLAGKQTVAIVSGRDREDVQQMVQLDLCYAGSHGFDIAGPKGLQFEYEGAQELLPTLDEAEWQLKQQLQLVKGVWVERKRFAIAVHFRQADASVVPEVDQIVEQVYRKQRQLKRAGGKKIFELKPDLPWDKGRAVVWLIEHLHLRGAMPLYIGDDTTDEDAFVALAHRGISICVQAEPRPTYARYVLKDCSEVETFIEALV